MPDRGPNARPNGNVTPFRALRRRRRGPTGEGLRTPRGQVLIVHLLTLLTFGLFLANGLLALHEAVDWIALAVGVAALAIAASRRTEGMPWACTHHEFALRTIIIGAVAITLAGLAQLLPVIGAYAVFARLAVALWVGVRAIVGLGLGVARKPFRNPKSLLL